MENRKEAPRLLVCGTGVRLGQMTLETFYALKGCPRVLCFNLPLETFATVWESLEQAEDATHRLQGSLEKPDERLGVPYRVLPGVSAIGAVLAVAERYLDEPDLELFQRGFSVYSASEILLRDIALEPCVSTFLVNLFRLEEEWPREERAWDRLVAHLERFYEPDHRVAFIECASGPEPTDLYARCRVGDLKAWRQPWSPQATLFLPRRPEPSRGDAGAGVGDGFETSTGT